MPSKMSYLLFMFISSPCQNPRIAKCSLPESQKLFAFDKGERIHSAVAFENFGTFIDTDLAPPKNSSGAKLFRENDVIFIGHVLNLFHRLSLLCLLNEVTMCFVYTRSPVSICVASWCASFFSLTFSSRLVCFLVEFWTLLPCLFYMFSITIA